MGLPDGAAITTLDTYCTFTNIPGPGVRTAYFAALESWPGGALEERRKPSGQRCAYACRCPEGVAAPLGCVFFLFLSKLWLVCPALRAFCACEAGVVSLPSACFACCRNAGRPLVKAVYLSFSCVPYLHLRKLPQGTANIRIDTDRLLLDLSRTHCLPLVDTGVDRLGIFCRHLPEGVLDDDRGIIANA